LLRAFGGAPGEPEGATAATQAAEPEREIRSTKGRDQADGSFEARRRRAEVTPAKSPAAGLGSRFERWARIESAAPWKTFLPKPDLKRGRRAPRRRDRSRRPLGDSRSQTRKSGRGPTPPEWRDRGRRPPGRKQPTQGPSKTHRTTRRRGQCRCRPAAQPGTRRTPIGAPGLRRMSPPKPGARRPERPKRNVGPGLMDHARLRTDASLEGRARRAAAAREDYEE